jgi:tRNA A37 threonylcarbamoyladenosine dehydratase
MTIIDGDVVDPTNRNRQLPALATNHGKSKAIDNGGKTQSH